MPYITESDYAELVQTKNILYDAAEEALSVLIGCCIPGGGCEDRRAILSAQATLRHALKGNKS